MTASTPPMGLRIVLFGATGMVGHGALLEALDDPDVASVLCVGRRSIDLSHPKLGQLVPDAFGDFEAIADRLDGYDACFWCIGVSSAGMDEDAYTRITYDLTMDAARVLHARNPGMRFCFVSGTGADASEEGRIMWARVKGRAENDLQRVGFREVIVFRPAFIRPMRGVVSRVTAYRVLYAVFGALMPLFRAAGMACTSVELGQAMLAAAKGRAENTVHETRDILALAARA